jgi:micrococcal nuclease
MVVWVIDGDTVMLRTEGGRRERVRLIGVDAPETWPRHDCFGKEATQALRRLIPPGSRVRTVPDIERRDRFGRLLLYLWTLRGDFVNAALVQAGYARTMTVPPDTSHASTLREAERTAQRTEAGLWRACGLSAGQMAWFQEDLRAHEDQPTLVFTAAGTR